MQNHELISLRSTLFYMRVDGETKDRSLKEKAVSLYGTIDKFRVLRERIAFWAFILTLLAVVTPSVLRDLGVVTLPTNNGLWVIFVVMILIYSFHWVVGRLLRLALTGRFSALKADVDRKLHERPDLYGYLRLIASCNSDADRDIKEFLSHTQHFSYRQSLMAES